MTGYYKVTPSVHPYAEIENLTIYLRISSWLGVGRDVVMKEKYLTGILTLPLLSPSTQYSLGLVSYFVLFVFIFFPSFFCCFCFYYKSCAAITVTCCCWRCYCWYFYSLIFIVYLAGNFSTAYFLLKEFFNITYTQMHKYTLKLCWTEISLYFITTLSLTSLTRILAALLL